MNAQSQYFSFVEVSKQTGISEKKLFSFVERKWISLCCPQEIESPLDHEDLARIHLIADLQRDFEVNDEAIPIILHLVDQLICLQNQIKVNFQNRAEKNEKQ